MPPSFSAIKVDGKRAYKSAREGKPVELKPRTVTIYSITEVKSDNSKHTISFVVSVSSGTYIRSLARDLGEKLGTGAYLSSLRRLTVGDFSVQYAITMDDLNLDGIQKALIEP